mgnify:CR=1 FL=1
MKNVLVLDNYDSFVYNLVYLLKELGANVDVFRNDKISLEIFSLTGQKIRSLLSEELIKDGTYVVQWDGLDQSANRVNPGTYIYRFNGEKTALKTGKIIVNPWKIVY